MVASGQLFGVRRLVAAFQLDGGKLRPRQVASGQSADKSAHSKELTLRNTRKYSRIEWILNCYGNRSSSGCDYVLSNDRVSVAANVQRHSSRKNETDYEHESQV